MFRCRNNMMLVLHSCIAYHQACNIGGTGTVYPTGTPEFAPGFQWGLCWSIIGFLCLAS